MSSQIKPYLNISGFAMMIESITNGRPPEAAIFSRERLQNHQSYKTLEGDLSKRAFTFPVQFHHGSRRPFCVVNTLL